MLAAHLCLLLTMAGAPAPAVTASPVTFYVAPTGSDAGPGNRARSSCRCSWRPSRARRSPCRVGLRWSPRSPGARPGSGRAANAPYRNAFV